MTRKEHADSEVFISKGPVNTFGCACRPNETNTLIDNSEAGELVQNNSQWHPGFTGLGSVPGVLPTGTIPPALPTGVQAAMATTVDQNSEIEDEDEDEANEEMDEIDNFDDALSEDSIDAFLGQALPLQMSYTLDPAEVEQSLSEENSTLDDEDSDVPDLEDIPMADPNNQQATQGNKQLKHG